MSTTINRHPDIASLMSYVAGSLPEPLAAGVSAHVSMCTECRRRLRDMELIGAELFRASPALRARKIEITVPDLEQDGVGYEKPLAHANRATEKLPEPIARKYGLAFDSIPWRPIGEGAWHYRLPLSPGVEGDLRLFKFAPGYEFQLHGHGGAEFTLVIDGAFSDATGEYRRGDAQDLDDETEHQPIVDEDLGCVCLIASDRPLES